MFRIQTVALPFGYTALSRVRDSHCRVIFGMHTIALSSGSLSSYVRETRLRVTIGIRSVAGRGFRGNGA